MFLKLKSYIPLHIEPNKTTSEPFTVPIKYFLQSHKSSAEFNTF